MDDELFAAGASGMAINEAALRSMDVFPGERKPGANREKDSLFDILNHCRTSGGRRLLDQWLRSPLTDAEKIGSCWRKPQTPEFTAFQN